MKTTTMIDTLKAAGIAKEWHKGDMHRLYIDLAKAEELYHDNNDTFQWARLNINRRERASGKLWIDLESGEFSSTGIYSSDEVISQIMELVRFLAPAEETNAPENTTDAENTTADLWYACMMDLDDCDWGTGSFDLAEAMAKVRSWRADSLPDSYIAVIDGSVCVEEIHDIE